MKIKQSPADFRVEELTQIVPRAAERYAIYRLTKTDTSMFEALSAAGHLLGVARHRVGYGGLKDARGITTQPVSVDGGPPLSGERGGVRIEYLGRSDSPVDRQSFAANRFAMTVRDLDAGEADLLADRCRQAALTGLPNYFDDQRFGSLRPGEPFVGRLLVEGRFDEALRLALTATRRKDRQAFKKRRQTMRDLWGQWPRIAEALPNCPERMASLHLAGHPGDYAGAFECVPREQRTLFLGAWQGYLWNETLRRLIERDPKASGLRRVPYRAGEFVFYASLPPERAWALSATEVPMPHAGMALGADAVSDAWRDTFSAERLAPADLTLGPLRDTKLHRNRRRALVAPAGLAIDPPAPDTLNPGRLALTLRFDLPRGSYATLMVK